MPVLYMCLTIFRKLKQYSKSAFPSGEGGPHGRVVDEENGVCTAQKTSVLNSANLFYILNKL